MNTKITIKGVSCNHCVAAVNKALKLVPGVDDVEIDLKTGDTLIKHGNALDMALIKKELDEAGYEIG